MSNRGVVGFKSVSSQTMREWEGKDEVSNGASGFWVVLGVMQAVREGLTDHRELRAHSA